MIGAGLAVNAVMHGDQVTVMDQRSYEELEPGFLRILGIFMDNAVCTAEEAERYLKSIRFTTDLGEAVKGAELIQESIVEQPEAKKGIVYRDSGNLRSRGESACDRIFHVTAVSICFKRKRPVSGENRGRSPL